MKMLIGGKKKDSGDGKTFDVINPATGGSIDSVPLATYEDVDEALARSKNGQKIWGATPLLQRERIINKFLVLLDQNRKRMALIMARETGTSVLTPLFELNQVPGIYKGYIETAKRYDGKILVPGTELGHDGHTERDLQLVVHEPIGTVVGIVPFNAPVLLASFKIAPALAAGNAVIIKPPSDNPLGVLMMGELILEAGVPGDAFQIVTGSGSKLGKWLAEDPRCNAVAFTGSTETGLELANLTAKHLSPCGLELGGNDPFIVMEDANIEQAAFEAVYTRMANSGQVCIAPKRFIVQNSVKERFTKKVLEIISQMEMGYVEDVEAEYERLKDVTDPLSAKFKLGSLISEKAAIEVERQVNHTIEQGATLAFGGKREGAFYFPTVLTGVTKEMDVAKDLEIFAPVIPIIGFDTVEDAIEIANQSSFGLSGAVFTKDYKLGMRVAQAVQSGGVVINGTTMYRNQMQPFGGYKMSGMGREGFVTLGEMVQEKVIVFKNFLT